MRESHREITRRRFCQSAAFGLGGLALGGCPQPATPEDTVPLPPPQVTGRSVELCLNSRVSTHFGLTGTATEPQIANVLWAAGRAPVTGSRRTIRLQTGAGTFTYEPDGHVLRPYSGDTALNALRLNYERERDFDAGVSYIFALLAGVSLWTGDGEQLASCPQVGDLNFGFAAVPGFKSERVAFSSDGSLPDPVTDGPNQLEDVLATANLAGALAPEPELTPQELSQILWAGYGCTPHRAFSGAAGLTVPSWVAQYFLTGRIYVIDARVARYHNHRDESWSTRDHRLETVHDEDVRAALRTALPELPTGPCYILLCLSRTGIETWYQRLETGFVAGAMLVQATSAGLDCALRAALSWDEQAAVQQVAHLPAGDHPHAIVALGRRTD